MHQMHFSPTFPPGKIQDTTNAAMNNSLFQQGRPVAPVRAAAPVSGRQASGASTPGTATSGRAGSTGRVVVQTRPTQEYGRSIVRRAPFASTVSSSSLNGPSGGQSSGLTTPHSKDVLEEPVRRARSAGRSSGGTDAKVSASSASIRRDSPLRNVSPKGTKPGRASPVRKPGAREVSRSPEPPRVRPPVADQASPEGLGNDPSEDRAQPTSFVESLARLALVLERNGQAGTGAAAAATAVAAVVAKQGEDGIGDIHQYLQSKGKDKPLGELHAQVDNQVYGDPEEGLRARCARLEHEVAELRVQVTRRLDQAALDVAASRQAAETATAQVTALRAELASILGQNAGQAERFGR
ncbi:unnamed protein product [Durusdinium trenchii]|uniref:Uncharacterized protein n=2 Tax=Durusdinium trenchii TaxID=1381693 RepID=A0ABP0STS0_9DINO